MIWVVAFVVVIALVAWAWTRGIDQEPPDDASRWGDMSEWDDE